MSSVKKIHLMCGPDLMAVGGEDFKVFLPMAFSGSPSTESLEEARECYFDAGDQCQTRQIQAKLS